ncbi:hypothetical protein [Polaromonas sp. AER18D-145]|uniref:hypothetical protein n=1 Tax=Polaromonas sp. AER18D-145 TaxID=1977060 RepID=UPI000BBCC007|nr:hypothetical protein [Polaromonas sp. AER18D-145]
MSAAQKSECQSGDWQNANLKTDAATVAPAENIGKQYATLQAQFALLGHSLQHTRRADDGRVTFVVSRWNQSRFFSHLNDVRAFLTQIGGAA